MAIAIGMIMKRVMLLKVHEFYRSLQFEHTGCTQRYNSIQEDVLGVSLLPDAPVWKRPQRFREEEFSKFAIVCLH